MLVYNGEISRTIFWRELRGDLERRGVTFHTTSDTENDADCLIHDAPKNALTRLDGMFAFAFYDTQEDTLIVARDRFGMKPMYYCAGDEFFACASEIKALRPWLPFEAEPFSITSYLLGFGGPTKGFTFYKGIKSLAPGDYLASAAASRPARRRSSRSRTSWIGSEMQALDAERPAQAVDRMERNCCLTASSGRCSRTRGWGRSRERWRRFVAARGDGGQGSQQSVDFSRQRARAVEWISGGAAAQRSSASWI